MNVPVGLATKVGYGLTALGLIATAWSEIAHELSGHAKWLAIVTGVVAVLTNLGRQMQAITAK